MIVLHTLAAAAGAAFVLFSLMMATVPDLRTDHGWRLWTFVAATGGVCLAGLLILVWGMGVI